MDPLLVARAASPLAPLLLLVGLLPACHREEGEAPAIPSDAAVTFTVGAAGSFTVIATGHPSGDAIEITAEGTVPSGLSFADRNDGTALLSGTPAAGTGGSHALTFTADNGVPPAATQAFALEILEAPRFTSADAASFAVGEASSFPLAASAYPADVTFELVGALPDGVTFEPATGLLAGTPLEGDEGPWSLAFTADNGVSPAAEQEFTLTIVRAPEITSVDAALFTAEAANLFTATADGYPAAMTFSATGSLPAGVTLDASTGALAGTPALGGCGTWPLVLTASNGVSPAATQTFTLTVRALEAPSITSTDAATCRVGTPCTFSVTATGHPAAMTYGATGALPTGVTLDPASGLFSGTPALGSGGVHDLLLSADNGVSPTATQEFTLTVEETPTFSTPATASFHAGMTDAFTIRTVAFPGGAAVAIDAVGDLPSGVTFTDEGDGTATIEGTAPLDAQGDWPLTLQASNGIAPDGTQSFVFTVGDPYDPTTRIHVQHPCSDDPNTAELIVTQSTDRPITIDYEDAAGENGGTLNLLPQTASFVYVPKGSMISFAYAGSVFRKQPTNDQTCAEVPLGWTQIDVVPLCSTDTETRYRAYNEYGNPVDLMMNQDPYQFIVVVGQNTFLDFATQRAPVEIYYDNEIIFVFTPTWNVCPD